MTLIDDPEPERSSRTVLYVSIALAAVLAGGILGYLALHQTEPKREPAPPPIAERKPAPPPAVTPAPEPEASPTPVRPRRPRVESRKPETPPPAPTAGTLQVDSDVPGASVFLDREYKGAAPVTIEGVTPGTHRLNVSADGYDGYADTVDVAVGPNAVTVKFREVRLNETVPVTHKHAMGSCQGRLVADPDGLRYETTSKGDAFSMKFSEIEAFEVDYLKKNLRIKRRGGKTYNFTNDNPDLLFVFHKNVQAARDKLAKADQAA